MSFTDSSRPVANRDQRIFQRGVVAAVVIVALVAAACSESTKTSGSTSTSAAARARTGDEPKAVAASPSAETQAQVLGECVQAGPSTPITPVQTQILAVSGVAMSGRGEGMGAVAFGGKNPQGALTAFTMMQDCNGTWQIRYPAHHPSAREGSMMAWDRVSKRLLLVGGAGKDYALFDDTWSFDGNDWTQLAPATKPIPKAFGAMATDPVTGRPVLYGGLRNDTGGGFAGGTTDTWTWDGSNWQQQHPAHVPVSGSLNSQAMATNPAGPSIVLMQQEGPNMVTYFWANNDWTRATASPTPVYGESLVTDQATGQVIWIGGIHDKTYDQNCNTRFAEVAGGLGTGDTFDVSVKGGMIEADGAGVGAAFGTMMGQLTGWLVCKAVEKNPNLDNPSVQYWTGFAWVPGPAFPTPTHLAAGNNADGTVAVVQSNQYGLSWDQQQKLPTAPLRLSGLSLGNQFSCGLQSNSLAAVAVTRPVCWGDNTYSQFASGVNVPQSATPIAPVGPELASAQSVVSGWYFACALLASGLPRCWGSNQRGQRGDGTTTTSNLPSVFKGFPSKKTAKQLVAGKNFACALMQQDGSVMCWGANDTGQLGNGTTTDSSVPVAVKGLAGATSITAGYDHACAVLANKTISCWGGNSHGQLGNSTKTNSNAPVQVAIISTATVLAAGSNFTCAVVGGGLVKCWGANDQGQLGNGTTAEATAPVAIPNLSGIVGLTAGNGHACGFSILPFGLRPSCWGANGAGQVPGATGNTLRPVDTGVTVANIAAGGNTTCYVQVGADTFCIGANERQQAGQPSGSAVNLKTWTKVSGNHW